MAPTTVTQVVASALLWRGRELLLLRRARSYRGLDEGRGLWEPPGGKLEPGEALEEALVREVGEETGLVVAAPRLADACSYLLEGPARAAHRVHLLYRVETTGVVQLSEEHDEQRWVASIEALHALPMLGTLRAALEKELRHGPTGPPD